MNGIRVGFITIHRGINFGTALQTFAMHTALERLGYSATLIDYQYPAKYHLSKAARDENRKRFSFLERFPLVFSVARTIKRLMTGEFWETRRQKDKFRAFLDRIPHTKEYDMAGIEKDPPQFDIYLTGSDQCWNPRYMHHDHSMLLNFARIPPRRSPTHPASDVPSWGRSSARNTATICCATTPCRSGNGPAVR